MGDDELWDTEALAAEQLALIPVEANLEIPPLFQMRRTNPTNRLAECRVPVTATTGERLEQYWRISVPEPYELPGTFDQDTWVAVQTLVNRRGGMPTDGKLSFSLYELLEIMGRPDNGQSYKELRESLQRLSATYIYSENAFYSKDIEKFETRGFNLWDVHFSHTLNKQLGRASEKHELEFHSVVRRSFQAEYLKALDKDFYYSLSSRFAKRLYRLIDRKRRDNLSWSVPLERLKQLLPLPVSYRYPSKIKTVLKTAHGELRERGFLTETSYEKGTKNPTVRYRVSEEFVRRRLWPSVPDTASRSESFSPTDERAYDMLREQGVWANVARQLVSRKGASHCLKYVAALSYQRKIEDPGAWLKWAIETDYELDETVLAAIRKRAEQEESAREAGAEDARQSSLFVVPVQQEPDSTPQSDTSEPETTQPPSPDPEAVRAWSSLVADLIELRGDEMLPPWFDQFEGGQVDATTLTIVVPNSTAANHLNENFGADLVRLWRKRAGEDAVLQVAMDLQTGTRAPLTE
ncbi:MAG: replication initiator protein A [Rubrobacter sp.]|nr:replication initiator protein A [Rubrobacter sp.]